MKTFYLRAKNINDIISKVTLESLEAAVVYFSKKKKLSIDDLLKIYDVTEKA